MADTVKLDNEPRPPRAERTPRTSRAAKSAAAKPVTDAPKQRSPQDRKLEAAVTELYQGLGLVGMGLGAPRNDAGIVGTSMACMEQAPAIAAAWMDLADRSPSVKAALKRLTEVSAMGTLVGLHVALAMPLLQDRGVVPGGPPKAAPTQPATADDQAVAVAAAAEFDATHGPLPKL